MREPGTRHQTERAAALPAAIPAFRNMDLPGMAAGAKQMSAKDNLS